MKVKAPFRMEPEMETERLPVPNLILYARVAGGYRYAGMVFPNRRSTAILHTVPGTFGSTVTDESGC